MSNNSGISLIEIMIVVAIVGILTGIAIPTYSTYILKAKATELFTEANTYKLEILEQEINNPQAVFDKVVPTASPNIESITLSTEGQNIQRRYAIKVISKIITPGGNLELKLLGHAKHGMLSWECFVPAAIYEYMPKSCQAI